MRNIKKMIASLAVAGMLCLPLVAEAAKAPADAPILHSLVMAGANINAADYAAFMWRSDTDSSDTQLPRNFRTTTSVFGKANPKYGLDESFEVSRKGLKSLAMSGSGEYTEAQFHNMVNTLGKEWDIYVIDLRRESHVLADGQPLSWWGERNWSNIGKSTEEIEAEEKNFAKQLPGSIMKAASLNGELNGADALTLKPARVMTERAMVEGAGLKYYRFPCIDHVWPEAKQVDAFIELVKTLPDNAWVHFHCVAGRGRTGSFMCMYDIMRNPDVSLKNIAYRQLLLGATYLLAPGDDSWDGPYAAERNLMLTTFYRYVQECGPEGYKVSWSEWLLHR